MEMLNLVAQKGIGLIDMCNYSLFEQIIILAMHPPILAALTGGFPTKIAIYHLGVCTSNFAVASGGVHYIKCHVEIANKQSVPPYATPSRYSSIVNLHF